MSHIPDEIKTRTLFSKYDYTWLPPPDLTVSQWADAERRLPSEASAEPGRWRTSRAEYQRAIMDAVADPQVERIVMMTSAQIGKTEILLNVIGYFADQEPSPMLVLQPTIQMGQAFSEDRLAPMIRDTPALKNKFSPEGSRKNSNKILHKTFPGGHITIAGANSPASLASRPIRILLCDEVDRYPQSAGDEGSPLRLAEKRTQNFWNRRILFVSTPTMLGASTIEKEYDESSREEWCLPCPTCGELQPLAWDRISYKDLSEPVMKCEKCGAVHGEIAWKAGQERGQWIAANSEVKNIRGFHLNAFASPWASWQKLISDYEEALRNGSEAVKVWWNTVLGLPYEEQAGTLEVEAMESHREEYEAELPDGVLCLTAGVDTQDDRLECEVVGWGIGKESWGIEYKVFWGDPGKAEVWQALDDFLSGYWSYADGERLGLSCVCIDSGGHHTDEVYKFCHGRTRRNIFAIVGRGAFGLASVSKPTRSNRYHVPLFTLGVSTIKGELFSRLRTEQQGSGYCHFPIDRKTGHRGYDATYFKGLLSERMVVKRQNGRNTVTWEPRWKGIRNEPLDTRVYATGAFEIIRPNLEALAKRRKKRKDAKPVNVGIKKPQEPVREEKARQAEPVAKQVRSLRRGFRILSRGLR